MLKKKQQIFVDEYLKCWNAAESARKAGYSVHSAYAIGWELLRKPEIRDEIQTRLDEAHMSADEALKLTSDIARGDMAQLMDISSVGFSLDMQRAKDLGLTKLIKKVKQKTTTYIAKKESEEDREVTELEVELYDAQAAARDILKIGGKFMERLDVTTDGKALPETKVDDARFDRAISSLADVLREVVSGKDTKQDGALDTAK